MNWTQVYDPLGHWWLSTLVAALPIIVLFTLLAGLRVRPHWCAVAGAATAMFVGILVFHMPLILAASAFTYGVAYGILKIAWIVLAAVYLYDISVETGQFEIMKESIAGITPDRRLQVLLVAFCFGAFIEGAAGFGAVLVESCARRLIEPSPTALATSRIRPSEVKGRECMRLSSATTGKSNKTWKSFNKAIEPKRSWLESQTKSSHTKTRRLDAKHLHPVIYSIFLISTSLNSQHLNGCIAKRVS